MNFRRKGKGKGKVGRPFICNRQGSTTKGGEGGRKKVQEMVFGNMGREKKKDSGFCFKSRSKKKEKGESPGNARRA